MTGNNKKEIKDKKTIILTGIVFFSILSSLISALPEEGPIQEKIILERGVLRKGIVENFFINLVERMRILFNQNFIPLVKKNPDVSHASIIGVVEYLILILEPLCILALLVSGVYFFFLSGSPWGRALAKSLIPGLIIAVLFMPFSLYFLSLIFSVSESFTNEIFLQSSRDSSLLFTNSVDYLSREFSLLNESSNILSLPFLLLIMSTLLLTLLVFTIRYLILTFLSIIFPLTLFLYLFVPTRTAGRRLFELTLSWTSVQIIAAIALVSINELFLTLPSNFPDNILIILELATSITLVLITLGTTIALKNYLPE